MAVNMRIQWDTVQNFHVQFIHRPDDTGSMHL
jgi:hypothetical protein